MAGWGENGLTFVLEELVSHEKILLTILTTYLTAKSTHGGFPGFSFTFLTHWNTIGKVEKLRLFFFLSSSGPHCNQTPSDSFPQSFGKALINGSEIPAVCDCTGQLLALPCGLLQSTTPCYNSGVTSYAKNLVPKVRR